MFSQEPSFSHRRWVLLTSRAWMAQAVGGRRNPPRPEAALFQREERDKPCPQEAPR